jgi:FkbM family methyltransferase
MKLLTEIRRRFHPLHRLRKSAAFRALVWRFDPMVTARLNGSNRRIYCRAITHASLLLADEDLEPGVRKTFAVLTRHCGANGSFWDIGANIGLFTFEYADAVSDPSIVSIEPDEKSLACLRKTSSTWDLRNHRIFAGVAGDEDGSITFHLDDASGATGTIEAPSSSFNSVHFNAVQRTTSVPMRTVDSLSREFATMPTLMKIDVEGAERRVLEGARESIRNHRPVLLMETFVYGRECADFLRQYDYKLFDADRCSAATDETTNFLCIPDGRLAGEANAALRELGYPTAS